MTVSPFSNPALSSNSPVNAIATIVAIDFELVRGTEAQVVSDLSPRVAVESVALNLAAVERIDAAGIAALITLYCTAVEAGTDFSVVSPSTHVLELLRIVGLEEILVADARPRGSERTRLRTIHSNAQFAA
jgi:anti-anti-sigma factor